MMRVINNKILLQIEGVMIDLTYRGIGYDLEGIKKFKEGISRAPNCDALK